MRGALACRLLVASLTLGPLVGCKSEPPSPDPDHGVAAAIRLVEGTPLSGVVGKELPLPLVVEVTDAAGKAVPNQIVNFRVISGGGSVFAGTGLTNAAGRVQERWTLGTHVSESQVLEARAVDNDTGAPLVFATFSATALPDVPSSMGIVSGDGQSGQAGAALANPLIVIVADQYGNPVPGVSVAWTAEDGNGSLETSATVTDGSGRASNRWTLGPVATAQHVRAESGSLFVRFSTAGIGGVATSLTKVSGDQQSALQGAAVLAPPTVKVTDSLGSPMAGIAVQFTVTAGGGTVLASSANTDASGLASCGGWTLGDSPGPNAVTASSQGLNPVVFSATATDAISISGGVSPGPSTLVGDSFVVYARVTAANPITSVTGSIGGAGVTFAYSPVEVCGSRGCSTITTWNGTMSGAGMFGPVTVTLTARDSLGHQASASVAVVVDRPPSLTVNAPQKWGLARPSIDIAATCQDDDPARECVVVVGGASGIEHWNMDGQYESTCESGGVPVSPPLMQSSSSIAQTLDLSSYEGGVVHLCIWALDSAGQKAPGVFRPLYVDSSASLAVTHTAPGVVLDASGGRTLYVATTATTATLRLLDSADATDVAIHSLSTPDGHVQTMFFGYPRLTPFGCIYGTGTWGEKHLREYRDGSILDLGIVIDFLIDTTGRYALIQKQPSDTILRDLTSGTDVFLTNTGSDQSVGPNGDVVYVGGEWGDVYRFRNGITTKITTDPPGAQSYFLPQTDGSLIIYGKGGGTEYLVVNDGITEVPIAGDPWTAMVSGGWVAYHGFGGVRRYSAAGDELIATDPDSVRMEALAPDGKLPLIRGYYRGSRYLSVPGSQLKLIGPELGTAVVRDEKVLVLMGGSVLEITP